MLAKTRKKNTSNLNSSPTVPQENADGPSELDVLTIRDGQRGRGGLRDGRAQGHREAAEGTHAEVRRADQRRAAENARPGTGYDGKVPLENVE